MKEKTLLYILLFTIASTGFGQQMDTNYKIFNTEDGLSQLTVHALLEDKNGLIWVGTEDGLNKYNGYEFITYRNIPRDSTSLSNNVVLALAEDHSGNIWIGTSGGGISKFNPKTETFQQFRKKEKDSTGIGSNTVYEVYVDSKDRVWVGHREGLDLYNPEKDLFERVLQSDPKDGPFSHGVNIITEDPEQNFWLGTELKGLVLFNPDTKQIEKEYQPDSDAKSTNNEYTYIYTLVSDDQGTLWISSWNTRSRFDPKTQDTPLFSKKLNYENSEEWRRFLGKTKSGKIFVVLKGQKLSLLDPATGQTEDLFNSRSNFTIRSVLQDKSGSFWIGTNTKGLIYIGANNKPFQYRPNAESTFADSKAEPETIYSMLEDDKGYLWFEDDRSLLVRVNPENGDRKTFPELSNYLKTKSIFSGATDIINSKLGGIWILFLQRGPIYLNPENGKFKEFISSISQNGKQLGITFIKGLETKDGSLWVGGPSNKFLISFDQITGEILKTYEFNSSKNGSALPGNNLTVLYEDLDKNLLIGFKGEGLHILNRETDSFTKISYEVEYPIGSLEQGITALYQNKKNILWVGTENGLFKYDTEKKISIRYGMEEGLPNPVIYDILDDDMGHLWLTTNNGISKFNPETAVFKNYGAEDGLKQSEFTLGTSFKSKKTDLMYLAGAEGYNFFDTKTIKDNPYIPEIIITNFKKNSLEAGFVDIPGINYLKNISLVYKERDFSVEFAALDYTNSSKNQYAYKLEGYNEDWVNLNTKRDVTFTSLSPGTYILRLKGSNNDGIWNEAGKSLKIEILPPWWGGWWAYALYALLAMGLLFGIYRYRYNQLENKRLVELDQVKRAMYTNITHEFRTPLTVITGMNKELQEYFNGEQEEHFDLIDRSSKNMLYLVNQLLELRKMEIGKTDADYIQGDIIPYVRYISETFAPYAATKDISLHFISILKRLMMDYDPDKLLIIVSNLLSNAIKYSSSGNDIYFQVEEFQDSLQLQVTDSGKGIPMKELPNIFDRFYKVIDKKDKELDGIGIGLAVTKELVQLLNGEITVRSQIGKGSVFTVLLPILNTAPLENTTEQQDIKSKFEQYFHTKGANFEEKNLPIPSEDKPTVLVIEDNQDIIRYLVTCLENQWNIKVANDGKEGIEKAIEIVPDIILSDLMMPNIDGYGVLDSVKNDERTSHIPVVILTAKADEVSRMETYKRGADSYLVKPFNKTELLIILEKLVEQRKALQQRYRTQDSLLDPLDPQLQKENSFILKIEKLVLNEHTEASLGVEPLCRGLSMSRTQLHNKVKALTGMSTSIFVRSIRLKKAKHLLEHTNKTISEIAYDVGFNHASYFTRSFTEEFGLPPSSLRK